MFYTGFTVLLSGCLTVFTGVYADHWLGNDIIHYLTNQNYYNLLVELFDWNGNKRYAFYEYFLVDSEKDGYRLHIDGYSGDAGMNTV